MSAIPTRERTPMIVRAGAVPPRRPAAAAIPPPPAARTESGMSGRDVVRVLRKRKWLILFSLVLCIGASVVATLLWLRYSPMYTSAALLEVRAPRDTMIRAGGRATSTAIVDALAAKFVTFVRTERVLGEAVLTPQVKGTDWYKKDPEGASQRLAGELSVSPASGSALIVVSMTGSDTKELPEIVNAVAMAAQEESKKMATQSTQEQIRQLQVERSQFIEQRDRLRAEKAELLRGSDVPDLERQADVLNQELRGLRDGVRQKQGEVAAAEVALENIKRTISTGQARSLYSVIRAFEYDMSLRALRQTLVSVRSERENLKRKYGPLHKTVQDYESRITSMQDEITMREEQLIEVHMQFALSGSEADKATKLQELADFREQHGRLDASIRALQASISEFNDLDNRERNASEETTIIDRRLTDLRMLREAETPLSVMQPAGTPRTPSFPKWSVMAPLGVLLGLVMGLGLSFLLEMIDTSIKGPSDITRRVDLPLLGMVPHQRDLEEDIDDFRLAFSTHPNSLVSEAFRQVRTCLQFSGPASQRRTLLITSPLPGDGRTTVAMNLAASAARNGRKVLVIDANFRQPMIKKLFAACPEGGLSSALVGEESWRDMTFEIEPNFSVMASGPLPPNPGELLGSEQMGGIIAEMVNDYDQVIFDAAPCLLVTDAEALSTLVDGVLIVVRAGANTHGIVQRARDMLDRIGGHVVGVVLNGVRTVAGGYLRKNYEAFYDYHERARLPKE